MMNYALYDADPYLVFKTTQFAEQLKSDFSRTPIFQDLITKYLLSDTLNNKIRFLMKPDPSFGKIRSESEFKQIDKLQKALTPEKIAQIKQDNENLRKRQEEQENIEILPKIDLKDIPKTREYPKFTIKNILNKIPIYFFDQPTNGIIHIRFKFDTKNIDPDLKKYLPLLSEYFYTNFTLNADLYKILVQKNINMMNLKK